MIVTTGCSSRKPIPIGEVPEAEYVSEVDEQYGHQVFSMLSEQYKISNNDKDISRVRSIVDKLAVAAYSSSQPWHVYVLEDDAMINAAATRGNYVVVWSGLLRRVENDGQLAAVLAHEVAHVLAKHTKPTPMEEVSHVLAEVSGNIAGQVVFQSGGFGAAASVTELLTKELIKATIINPEQRRKEAEADQIGLFLMARAKYNPNEAYRFWQLLEKSGETDSSIPFLSTHPTSTERLERIKVLLPEAENVYDIMSSSRRNSQDEWAR